MSSSATPQSSAAQRSLARVDHDTLARTELGLSREWLETDGCGGYASSSVLGCATRRYHGLLVAIPDGSSKRHVFLSRFDEAVSREGRSFGLSMASYGDTLVPEAQHGLESFDLSPYPRWRYRFGLVDIVREVLSVRGSRTTLVRWSASGPREGIKLTLKPIFAYREADALTYENMALDGSVERAGGCLSVRPYAGLPSTHLSASIGAHRADLGQCFEADPVWYRGITYPLDAARGFDGAEDQFAPGWMELALEPGDDVVVAISIDGPVENPAELWARESTRRETEASGAIATHSVRDALALAAEDFLYRDGKGRLGVIAGYPWFGEWGRDTYIALPGLTLARGDEERCREVLLDALGYLRDGLLPNIFGTGPEDSHYGSADAALWYALAVDRWAIASGNRTTLLDKFRPALESIAEAYIRGTDLGLRVAEDGLLEAGTPELNATWMDAQTSTGPVTPRHGFAVELQALWYSLLEQLSELCRRSGDSVGTTRWADMAHHVGKSFLAKFWLKDDGMLADTWHGGKPVRAVRCNAVIAAALMRSPLDADRRASIVRHTERELLTPRGLRTLSPKNTAYIGRYHGGPEERDGAYHQGTVWPWPMGFMVEATLRAFGPDSPEVARIRGVLEGFGEHLLVAGLGTVSEVFDGDPPHRPGGSIAQAWSVSELLRGFALLGPTTNAGTR